MDTSFPSVSRITPEELAPRLGRADTPWLLDVRPEARFAASPQLLAGARRCAAESLAALVASQAPREAVVYCVYGHEVGAQAAALLRAAGWDARALAGGIEGGEDGVDGPTDIARWRAHPLPLLRKRHDLGVTGEQASRWITRARPKIDRVACPWLIRRFIDPRAVFFYVPAAEVLTQAGQLGAVPFDVPGAPVSHLGELCSFDGLLAAFGLQDAALSRLARIVRGADTDCLSLAPESAGLLALSLGLSQIHADNDPAMLEAALPMYDALYARCQSTAAALWQGTTPEGHRWVAESAAGGAR